jgi:hypothetical protein
MRKVLISFLSLLICFKAYSQVYVFPYNEGFEWAFTIGTNVDFIPNWNGNEVQASSRIFKDGTNMMSGTGSLGIIPTTTFSGTIIINLSFSTLSNATANFWGRSIQNGTGTKPAIVNFSISTDGGGSYSAPTQIGTDSTFPNSNTSYANYIYNFPAATNMQSTVKLKIEVSPGVGSGFTARLVIDDFQITGTSVADVNLPIVLSMDVLSSNQLDIYFSEAVEQTSAENSNNYSVDNGIGIPVSAIRDIANYSLVHLTFSSSFGSGVTNTITFNNISDFSTNTIDANTTSTFIYYQTVPVEAGDVVINEVLFHAEIDGKEFVELYNRSSKYLDLKDIYFYDASVSNPLHEITSTRRVFLPAEYVVITEDTIDIINRYFVQSNSTLIKTSNLPALTDESDTVRISTSAGALLDQLVYFEDWQFPLLNTTAGISLERLHPDRRTQDSTNWHSAAEHLRATPGYKNSQYSSLSDNGSEVQVEPEIFSPDEDGKDDNLNIHFHFSSPGNTVTVQVFDAKGRLVRKLISNQLIGNDGTFSWDGLSDTKEKARIGIYIFYIEVFNLKGNTKNYKRTCVLASKL